VSDPLEPRAADDFPLEEVIEAQALVVDLKVAVMACLSGQESRRWTVGELVERFKALGICASRPQVTTALADLELELELASWAPWSLVERGTEWILVPKSELLGLLAAARKLPVKGSLSETQKAVLLVVIGYRRKGGVSKTRIGEILKLDPSPLLDELLRQELVYGDPARELIFWRPTQSALLALGLKSSSDIPALKELEDWFEARESKSGPLADPDPYFEKTKKLHSRRLKRDLERRGSLRGLAENRKADSTDGIAGEERRSDLLRRDVVPPPLPHPALHESPESIVQSPSG
jgi:chromosome segregation and condensation protein ScpB